MPNILTKHPYITGGALLVGVVLFIGLRSGSSSASTGTVASTVDPSVVGAGMQLAAMQAQLTAHSQDVNAAAAAEADKNAVTLAIAKITADQNTMNMNLQAALGMKQLQTQENLAVMQSTLQAQIAGAQIQSQNQAMQLQHADTTAQINATLESQKGQNELMKAITMSNIDLQKLGLNLNAQTTQMQMKSQQSVAEQSWLNKIFGW
jgi:hypothetical protein